MLPYHPTGNLNLFQWCLVRQSLNLGPSCSIVKAWNFFLSSLHTSLSFIMNLSAPILSFIICSLMFPSDVAVKQFGLCLPYLLCHGFICILNFFLFHWGKVVCCLLALQGDVVHHVLGSLSFEMFPIVYLLGITYVIDVTIGFQN